MIIVHVAGKIFKMAVLLPVIRIPKPVPIGLDVPNDAQPIPYSNYDEYEYVGEDWKGEHHYRLLVNP